MLYTKDVIFLAKYILHSLKQRNMKDKQEESTFDVSELLNQINASHNFFKEER